MRRGLQVGGAVGVLSLLGLFVYNSGFGHDALEYLVIGRSLIDGHPLYDFVPSKSWGLYALAAAFLSLPGADSHLGVTLLVVGLILLVTAVTRRTIDARFGPRAGWLAASLVAMAAVFMELNFFQPEPLVFLCGLLAFRAVATPGRLLWTDGALAGLWLGLGMAFKSVAAFYLVACVWWCVSRGTARSGSDGRVESWRSVAGLGAGFGFAVGVPALYFAATGRLGEFLEWSYWFPMFTYPANADWLSKLYTKLLWVWAVVFAAALLWRRLPLGERQRLRSDASLLTVMGLVALMPLLKTQASHYAFPGAAFLLLASAVVLDRWLDRRGAAFGTVLVLVSAVTMLGVISGLLYRPDAVQRLVQVRSWEQERVLASAVRALARPDEFVLSLGEGASLYWTTKRYPNWPVVNTEVQTTYLLASRGASLLEALDDPQLALVEFDPERRVFDDRHFLRDDHASVFIREVELRLKDGWVRRDDVFPPLVFWVRRSTSGTGAAQQ